LMFPLQPNKVGMECIERCSGSWDVVHLWGRMRAMTMENWGNGRESKLGSMPRIWS
jgi:hypothetical protein